jgi:GNAT superfamily N-acetyltransferase
VAVEVVTYEPRWLPQLAALGRAHARLVPPWIVLADEEVERGLTRHAAWPFYTPGLAGGEILLAVEGDALLAAGQLGIVGTGWGYGAALGDGPEWLHDAHLSLFWLFAWPGWPAAQAGAVALSTRVVAWARSQGLPGLEAFRGGPGFLPFGTQLSRHWPHLWAPLRAAGFRQPRDLLTFGGQTAPDALPADLTPIDGLVIRGGRWRQEARWHGRVVGTCLAAPLGADGQVRGGRDGGSFADGRVVEWAAIRRLVVEREVRGQGIGAALFAAQLRQLHLNGVKRYLLHVAEDPDDLAPVRLYGRFGRLVDVQQVLRLSF